MKILLDECVDWRLLRDLPNHDVKTVRHMGWTETINGALLRLAERHFDVLITTDKNLHRRPCPTGALDGSALVVNRCAAGAARSRRRGPPAAGPRARTRWLA